MKVSKVFGFVLCLHLGAITVLLVQPGCRTTQPPTQIYQQDKTIFSEDVTSVERTGNVIPGSSFGGDAGLDAAFNAGMSVERSSPRRPAGEFTEFGEFDQIKPLQSLQAADAGQTVTIAGASVETYTVKKGDSLWAIAKANKVSVNELLSLNSLDKSAPIKIGQKIKIPVDGGSVRVSTVTADSYQPSAYNTAAQNYSVQRGDSLSKIANKFGTSVAAIKAANNKTSDMIRVGEDLLIPVAGSSANPSEGSLSPATTSLPSASDRTHTVTAGEYPATIARKYGMTSNELLAINGITDPRALQVGQKLKVSRTGSARNVDSRIDTVTTSSSVATTTIIADASRIAPAVTGPVQIRVIEADPLIEEEAAAMDADSMFDDAIEIPVIRMEE
ncbi:MAG: LysM repeat protein [Lentimonas sp.]|jgi:LysM repeat protein